MRDHMKQQRYASGSGDNTRKDDQLPPFYKKLVKLTSDFKIIAQTASDPRRVSTSGNIAFHTIRDEYAGLGLFAAVPNRTANACYRNLKFFAGTDWKYSPNIIVKSDVAPEIRKAVEDLGWHPEFSLPRTWPHNAKHERWLQAVEPVSYTHLTLPTICSV